MRLILAAALALAGCSGGGEALNEVELDKAANQLANETDAMVNKQINAIDATRDAAEQVAENGSGNSGNSQ